MSSPYWDANNPVEIDPDFDRLRTALFCQEPDRVPLLELFHDLDVKEAFLGRPIRNLVDDIEFHTNAGYDYYTFGFQYEEILVAYSQVGVSSTGPASTLYGKANARHWVPERTGVISNRKDFEQFHWPDPANSKIMAMANVFDHVTGDQAVKDATLYLPSKMKLIHQTDGIFERFTKLMGLETMSLLLYDDLPLVEAMFEIGGRLAIGLFEYMASQSNLGALWLADDLAYGAGPLVSPRIYQKYLFPWYRKIAEIAHDADCPLIFHSDGNLMPILDELVDIGFNAIQPIEPNAMDIRYLKEKYGGKLCLVGNIDLGYTLTLGTIEEVKTEVRQRIRDIAPGGGYCLGSSNTVTNYVPPDNFRAMIAADFAYGRYPIRA